MQHWALGNPKPQGSKGNVIGTEGLNNMLNRNSKVTFLFYSVYIIIVNIMHVCKCRPNYERTDGNPQKQRRGANIFAYDSKLFIAPSSLQVYKAALSSEVGDPDAAI